MIRPALVVAFAFFTAFGCSSSSDSGTPADAADTGASDATPDIGQTGEYVGRDAMCARYAKALQTKAAEIKCSITPEPKCPDLVDAFEKANKLDGKCVGYDVGTIAACEALIASYTACGDFSAKPCALVVTIDSRFCPASDAGPETSPADAADDATATDAAEAG